MKYDELINTPCTKEMPSSEPANLSEESPSPPDFSVEVFAIESNRIISPVEQMLENIRRLRHIFD